MKVLFAVSNDNVSSSIIKKYQEKFKEIITSKNVYYFNAIIKELQKDKTYDAVVIGEDLEPISNNNYDTIDKFIFDKLDNISDEAYKATGEDIPIILICSDRRTKSDELLIKLFGIGIYNALLGNDRNIDMVCNLINKPRSKKEAKAYYRVDSEDVNYKPENESEVSETEIKNILNHYKKIGNNEKKCVESFDSIASQYNDTQLRIIIKFLPNSVKAILEKKSVRYQKLVTGGTVLTNGKYTPYSPMQNGVKKQDTDFLTKDIEKPNLTKPVIIPSTMNINVPNMKAATNVSQNAPQNNIVNQVQNSVEEQQEPVQVKRRGRPRKINVDSNSNENNIVETNPIFNQDQISLQESLANANNQTMANTNQLQENNTNMQAPEVVPVKRGRGRPKKASNVGEDLEKNNTALLQNNNTALANQNSLNLFELANDQSNIQDANITTGLNQNNNLIDSNMDINNTQNNIDSSVSDSINLFDMADDNTQYAQNTNPYDAVNNNINPYDIASSYNDNSYDTNINHNQYDSNPYDLSNNNFDNIGTTQEMSRIGKENNIVPSNFVAQNKIVAFVGTSKNGTSFIVNNLAELLAQKGIKTAILDLTKNKNSYYMFTDNDQRLMQIATQSIKNLERGIAQGVEVNKNLTVYTALPDELEEPENFEAILQTLDNNYSAILMDCDFETNINYFIKSTEIYLVQSMDALTIQPLTQFLSELKLKNALDETKLRVIINKEMKMKILNDKMILGGMAKYNEPSMTLQRDLFNPATIRYVTIPFEMQTYARYLEAIALCQISLSGYSEAFLSSLEKLANMVYPLVSGGNYTNYSPNYKKAEKRGFFKGRNKNQPPTQFSSGVNDTLNKMRTNY